MEMGNFLQDISSMTRTEIARYLTNKNYKKKKISPVYFVKSSKKEDKK